jgi:isoleucyl-tRNA synthetase
MENLSNWYVRLNRKRFWGGEFDRDKLAAYQTLYSCLETVTMLAAPIAPFYTDQLFKDLNSMSEKNRDDSVHLSHFSESNDKLIDKKLEQRMKYAQTVSSLVLALRRKVNIKVRQPLNKIMIPVLNEGFEEQIEAVKTLFLTEVNVKQLEFLKDTSGVLVKKIKPNFKALGPKYGKMMKMISGEIAKMGQEDIALFEKEQKYTINVNGEDISLLLDDVEILSEDIPGWLVASEGHLTVALDINVTEELREEGIAREFINRIQNHRKESGLDVTDKIILTIQKHDAINSAINKFNDYIATQTLAEEILLVEKCNEPDTKSVEIEDGVLTYMNIQKVS